MRRPIVACLLVLSGLAGGGTVRADDAGPVWALRGSGGGTVYLAGSVHVLDAARSALPAGFAIAYRDAERLVMEIDMDDLDPLAAASFLAARGSFTDGETLRAILEPARYARIDAAARTLGLPLDSVAQLEPWAVALGLTQLQLAKLGLDPQSGVEQQITAWARRDGKPIAGLESVEEQLGVLDGLSYADQARFLELTVDEADSMPSELDRLLAAWRRGDTRILEQLLLEEYEKMPTLYRPLVADRNRRWLPQIEALTKRADDTLVVVGALHLVGPEGLLALLRSRGVSPGPVDTRRPTPP
ncbi:MAG: hypothetical protein NAOJABEB_01135 [Steroidobacteraceae bacterium]|nr:hypothetical protein [Steroidobacteraceae bacterium]